MLLVIPLLNNGSYDPLRFALRSITTYHHITDCILVGGKPDWYTGTHIVHQDYGPVFKEANIRDKVLAAASIIKHGNYPSLKFLFANDDHILLSSINAVYNKGLLSECLSKRVGNGSYTRCLRNTLEHYGDVLNIDTHCPMFMDAKLVDKTNFEWPEFGIGFKTCYAQENNISSVYMDDCKVDDLPVNRQWFSMLESFPLNKLVGIFPGKCKFEV